MVVHAFREELEGKNRDVEKSALDILQTRFMQVGQTEGYRKDGPVAVAKFKLGEGNERQLREMRALRQRVVSDAIEQFLARIGY
ncbi:hypothetical protein [Burkholderia gladioli]|uniref:hypothetical protein n=1 Tax=Burkholderia gladioli TaxID=28095 RepID=UPI001FC82D27|nr:hypothetical protein [Burkholderia gladioli]